MNGKERRVRHLAERLQAEAQAPAEDPYPHLTNGALCLLLFADIADLAREVVEANPRKAEALARAILARVKPQKQEAVIPDGR